MKKNIFKLYLFLLLFVIIGCEQNTSKLTLSEGKWAPDTRARLQKLIDDNGIKNADYDSNKKPYAVFDWDQTCIFNDTQESMFRYMIDNLEFKATPEEFAVLIRKNIPKNNFSTSYNNQKGERVNIDKIGADLDLDYKFLYDNYINGKAMTLEDVKQTDEFKDFQAKYAYLYEAIGGTFSADISYPWVLYSFTGMTPQEVADLAEKANDYALKRDISTYTLSSPESRKGTAGVISLDGYKDGLRIEPEIADLMAVLMANGIDVYICSASHQNVVEVFASLPKYTYNVPKENVLGMRTKVENGKFISEYEDNWPQTQQRGKTEAIESVLVSKYGYGPILVCGDSQGDYYMATDFPETQLTLIINRLRTDDFGKLSIDALKQKGQENARYVMQGRDENKGEFRPDEATIKMGTEEAKLLNDALEN